MAIMTGRTFYVKGKQKGNKNKGLALGIPVITGRPFTSLAVRFPLTIKYLEHFTRLTSTLDKSRLPDDKVHNNTRNTTNLHNDIGHSNLYRKVSISLYANENHSHLEESTSYKSHPVVYNWPIK